VTQKRLPTFLSVGFCLFDPKFVYIRRACNKQVLRILSIQFCKANAHNKLKAHLERAIVLLNVLGALKIAGRFFACVSRSLAVCAVFNRAEP
jgi:hypothetical protein